MVQMILFARFDAFWIGTAVTVGDGVFGRAAGRSLNGR
jgi:hypothetical protein